MVFRVIAVLLLLSYISMCSCFLFSGPYSKYNPYCMIFECCNDNWILQNTYEIESLFERDLFGQHLAEFSVHGALKGHATYQPSKPLVLSFHGPAGTGKNFVSKMIAKSWFRQGMESRYVHFYSGTKDFPLKSEIVEYAKLLIKIVYDGARKCKHSLFIFDEIDSFPMGLLDSIRTYLEYHDEVDGVDFRNAIFLFLSNTGEEALANITIEVMLAGRSREDIKLVQAEKALTISIEETGGGLCGSHLMEAYLISHFVPFLPMEKSHVRECIRREMFSRRIGQSEKFVSKVIDELQFYGPDDILSVKGCKNVAEKISLVRTLEKMNKRNDEL